MFWGRGMCVCMFALRLISRGCGKYGFRMCFKYIWMINVVYMMQRRWYSNGDVRMGGEVCALL